MKLGLNKTKDTLDKEKYDPEAAEKSVKEDAKNYLIDRKKQLLELLWNFYGGRRYWYELKLPLQFGYPYLSYPGIHLLQVSPVNPVVHSSQFMLVKPTLQEH